MSTPYPPPGGGQQPPGPYGAPGPSSWGPASGGQPYGGPGAPGPGYGGFGGPGGGSQGYGPGPGQQAPGQQGPGQSGPGQYGPGPQGPGQYGPGPQGGGQQGPGQQGPGGSPYGAPTQKAPKPPKGPGKPVDLGRILPLALAALGLLGFIFGFLHALSVGDDLGGGSMSVYRVVGYLPILVVLVGLFGVAPLLPGGKKYTLPTALLSVATLLAAITALISVTSGYGASVSRGAGLILLLIVALLEAAVAVYAWLTESGAVKPATATVRSGSSSSGSGKPGSAGSGSGQLPPVFVPPAGGQSGAQPPSGDRGGSGGFSPGGFGAPYQQGQAPEAGAYGGYQPTGYRLPGVPGDTYGGAQPAAGESAGSPYGPPSGGGDQSEAYGAQPTSGYGDAPGRQEPADKRQGDDPPPDVTQQVRF